MSERLGATDAHRVYMCEWCGGETLICRRCDRGNSYCSTECSSSARRYCLRRIRSDHQRTIRGAEFHRARQRAYRRRQKARVTDHSVSGPSSPPAAPSLPAHCYLMPPDVLAPAGNAELTYPQRDGQLTCSLCDSPVSEWVWIGIDKFIMGYRMCGSPPDICGS